MLRSVVIIPNKRTKELGSILQIARCEARKRERADRNPPIRALSFFSELDVYVAVYEAKDRDVQNAGVAKKMKL